MIRLLRILAVGFFSLITIALSARTTITVSNQGEFDKVQEKLEKAVLAGNNNICIVIRNGRYIATEGHIKLKDIQNPRLKLRIKGQGSVTIVPDGKWYKDGDDYDGPFFYDNSWISAGRDIENWTHVKYAVGQVEVVNENSKLCRLKSKEHLSNKAKLTNAYILIPCWFRAWVYKVEKIENDYIYFTADNLSKNYNNKYYNVNNDWNYGKAELRYKICNVDLGEGQLRVTDGKVKLPKGVGNVWEGISSNFISVNDCRICSLEISKLLFEGFVSKENSSLIKIRNVISKSVLLKHCTFKGVREDVIAVYSTANVCISNCQFGDCYYRGFFSDNQSKNTVVENNTFFNMGKRMYSSCCITCQGENYLISNNTLTDFGYGGIRVGVWYGDKQICPCYGIVENNYLLYSNGYLADIMNRGLMDSGAIYVCTKNDKAVIRNNTINNFSGAKDNRGIFCDDGAYNLEIYGNLITGTANCYSIDARRVNWVEMTITPQSGIERANLNNHIHNNVVDKAIRFEGHEDADNGCVMGENFYLTKDNQKISSQCSNIMSKSDDVLVNYSNTVDNKILVGVDEYRKLSKSQSWRYLKSQIVSKR